MQKNRLEEANSALVKFDITTVVLPKVQVLRKGQKNGLSCTINCIKMGIKEVGKNNFSKKFILRRLI
jgi:hypothetical protein